MMKKRLALYVWGGGGVGSQSMLKKGVAGRLPVTPLCSGIYRTSNRSAFITLFQAAMKSARNFCWASSQA